MNDQTEMHIEALKIFGKVPATMWEWEAVEDILRFIRDGSAYRCKARLQAREEKAKPTYAEAKAQALKD